MTLHPLDLPMLGALVAAFVAMLSLAAMDDPATIGGTAVPGDLTCQEDEAITFVSVDTLTCVHIEEVTE